MVGSQKSVGIPGKHLIEPPSNFSTLMLDRPIPNTAECLDASCHPSSPSGGRLGLIESWNSGNRMLMAASSPFCARLLRIMIQG